MGILLNKNTIFAKIHSCVPPYLNGELLERKWLSCSVRDSIVGKYLNAYINLQMYIKVYSNYVPK